MNELMNKIKPLLEKSYVCLEIFVTIQSDYGVCFRHCYVKDGPVLLGICGFGKTVEEALANYIEQISGKTLVFDSENDRKEIIVLL